MQQLNSFIFKNLANAVSILGVLPICILFHEGGFQYLIPLIIYNNVMDDLDGILAGKLNIRSGVGATMDNVCDAIAHSIFVMVVGMYFGGICVAASLIGATAIVLRIVIRLDPGPAKNAGSPTNELIRHLFFVLVLAQLFELSAAPYVIVVFLLHAVSMLIPYKMPYLLRSMDEVSSCHWSVEHCAACRLVSSQHRTIYRSMFYCVLHVFAGNGIHSKK